MKRIMAIFLIINAFSICYAGEAIKNDMDSDMRFLVEISSSEGEKDKSEELYNVPLTPMVFRSHKPVNLCDERPEGKVNKNVTFLDIVLFGDYSNDGEDTVETSDAPEPATAQKGEADDVNLKKCCHIF